MIPFLDKQFRHGFVVQKNNIKFDNCNRFLISCRPITRYTVIAQEQSPQIRFHYTQKERRQCSGVSVFWGILWCFFEINYLFQQYTEADYYNTMYPSRHNSPNQLWTYTIKK